MKEFCRSEETSEQIETNKLPGFFSVQGGLLIAKDNELHEVFLAARKDRQKLQELKGHINALDAGLYEALSELPKNKQGYVDGLSLIVERLYESDLSAILRAPEEAGTREFFAQKLQ